MKIFFVVPQWGNSGVIVHKDINLKSEEKKNKILAVYNSREIR